MCVALEGNILKLFWKAQAKDFLRAELFLLAINSHCLGSTIKARIDKCSCIQVLLKIHCYSWVCACVCLCAPHVCRCPWRKESNGSPGTKITGSFGLPDAGAGKQAGVFYKSSKQANYSAISQISPQIRCFRTWLLYLLAQTVDILNHLWHQIMLLELCVLRLCVHNYSGKSYSRGHMAFLLQITGFQCHWQAFSIVLSFSHPSVELSHHGIKDTMPSAPKQACQGQSRR